MNLEEIKKMLESGSLLLRKEAAWLIDEVEKLRESIEQLKSDVGGVALGALKSAGYQRRHRKWALQQCKTWQRYFCFYKDDAIRFHPARADKAEAELAKWTRKHDKIDLRALREQAAGSHSLAAHAAYINGLETHLRQAEALVAAHEEEIAELRVSRQKLFTRIRELE